jgi:putative membrane protein
MEKVTRWALAGVVGMLIVSAALAVQRQRQTRDGRDDNFNLQNLTDEKFAQMATEAGQKEVNLGNIALERAENPQVKKFAQRMVDDHTKANKELLDILNRKNAAVAAPADKPKQHEKVVEKMAELRGTQFDRAFMRHILQDHRKAVALFAAEAKSGQDPALKEFAEKTLPTLKEHLQMAQDLAGGGRYGSGQERKDR